MADLEVTEVDLPAMRAVRAPFKSTMDPAALQKAMMGAFNLVDWFVKRNSLTPNGPMMVTYDTWGPDGTSAAAILPIVHEGNKPLVSNVSVRPANIPARKALKFVHRGSYEDFRATYEKIGDYLVAKGLAPNREDWGGRMPTEEYVNTPMDTKAENLVTNIYVPV